MLKTWLRAMRVNQWTKNAFVLMAWFFAFGDPSQSAAIRGLHGMLLVAGMAASFCLVCSSFYLYNDVCDYDADRMHPQKRFRPIAAGLISKEAAVRSALVLFGLGMVVPSLSVMRHPDRMAAFGTILAYSLLQCFYTGFLKRAPYVDVVVIAVGFVLRAVAGAAVINARISPWLLVCTFVLSLFLALAKRRHEKALSETSGETRKGEFRESLARYHLRVIDVLMLISAVATVGVYVCYTICSQMGARFPMLVYTGVFVAAGVVRYLVLVYRHADVGRPEKVLYSDWILWLILVGYALTAVYAVMFPQIVQIRELGV